MFTAPILIDWLLQAIKNLNSKTAAKIEKVCGTLKAVTINSFAALLKNVNNCQIPNESLKN